MLRTAVTRHTARSISAAPTIGCGRSAPTPRVDTRADPTFPRNAFLLGAGWTALHVRSAAGPHRSLHDRCARLRRAIPARSVVAARVAIHRGVGARCPPTNGCCSAERPRCAGSAPARSTAIARWSTSAELRVPITSVLSSARSASSRSSTPRKAWDFGERDGGRGWHRGAGGGVFLIAPIVKLNLDIAHGLTDGDTDSTWEWGSRPDSPDSSPRTTHWRGAPPAGACPTGTSTRHS